MDIDQLRYFITVAQTLNFSEAARRHGLSQPSISHHINALENHLGTQLFQRDKRTVVLTDTGRAFFPHALEIVDLANRSEIKLEKMKSGKSGHLNISAMPSSSAMLQRCLRAFVKQYPDILVDINIINDAGEQTMTINDEHYDIFFSGREMIPVGETFGVLPLETTYLCVALPEDHPLCEVFRENGLDLTKLRGERFIAFSEDNCTSLYRQSLAVCRARGYNPIVFNQLDGVNSVALAVGAGCGISVLSSNLRSVCYADNIALFPLEGDDARRDYVMAWRKDSPNPVVQLFTEIAAHLFSPEG